ncbi:hypothetical protein HU200_037155 [Digitaria exilis]|uniref:Uncharacterized protein n=1 Tax=Digitaria exilis TaxID=1010633 RepID=A0A835BRF6_9POAL|nr:hypothetical protein HU200_037155 [Digitaria exilis]
MHNGVRLDKAALTSPPRQYRRYNTRPLLLPCTPPIASRLSPTRALSSDLSVRRPLPQTLRPQSEDPMAALGSKLAQLQSKACEATRFVAKHGCTYHKTLMEKNKHYVVDPPTIEKCQELSKQLFYTRLASLPGRYESFWKELDSAKLLWKNRSNLKVEDAGVAALFGIELYAWSCLGEIVGRGFTLTGYHV